MSAESRRDLENKIEAIVIAIPREQEAYEFYMQLRDDYSDKSSKEMFEFLAQQELKHKERLEELLAELERKLAELKK